MGVFCLFDSRFVVMLDKLIALLRKLMASAKHVGFAIPYAGLDRCAAYGNAVCGAFVDTAA